jgi:hypothetical protein
MWPRVTTRPLAILILAALSSLLAMPPAQAAPATAGRPAVAALGAEEGWAGSLAGWWAELRAALGALWNADETLPGGVPGTQVRGKAASTLDPWGRPEPTPEETDGNAAPAASPPGSDPPLN